MTPNNGVYENILDFLKKNPLCMDNLLNNIGNNRNIVEYLSDYSDRDIVGAILCDMEIYDARIDYVWQDEDGNTVSYNEENGDSYGYYLDWEKCKITIE